MCACLKEDFPQIPGSLVGGARVPLKFWPEGQSLLVRDSWRWSWWADTGERCWGRKLRHCVRTGEKNLRRVVDKGDRGTVKRTWSELWRTMRSIVHRYWQGETSGFKPAPRSEWLQPTLPACARSKYSRVSTATESLKSALRYINCIIYLFVKGIRAVLNGSESLERWVYSAFLCRGFQVWSGGRLPAEEVSLLFSAYRLWCLSDQLLSRFQSLCQEEGNGPEIKKKKAAARLFFFFHLFLLSWPAQIVRRWESARGCVHERVGGGICKCVGQRLGRLSQPCVPSQSWSKPEVFLPSLTKDVVGAWHSNHQRAGFQDAVTLSERVLKLFMKWVLCKW